MSTLSALAVLFAMVIAIVGASRSPHLQPLFRWFPVPLWCYALPAAAVALGWLPRGDPIYRALTDRLLPVALGLLLIGVDVPAVFRAGGRALIAAGIGAGSIIIGTALAVWALHGTLPAEAWKGAGALAGTWTGGTMNLLALRAVLQIPEAIFAPLIVVDALIAYGWMAVLVAASGLQGPIDRWLGAAPQAIPSPAVSRSDLPARSLRGVVLCTLIAVGLSAGAGALSARLPTTTLISSAAGWTVLLATTGALTLSLVPAVRRVGVTGERLGYVCLYLVLAATGAQANVQALWAAPAWILVGLGVVLLHAAALLLTGRLLRIPLGILATASQANIGGVVSAPLVGAVYHQAFAPVGLLLAMAGNALGTYFGLLAATVCHWLMRLP